MNYWITKLKLFINNTPLIFKVSSKYFKNYCITVILQYGVVFDFIAKMFIVILTWILNYKHGFH